MKQTPCDANSFSFTEGIAYLLWNARFITVFTRACHWFLHWLGYESTSCPPTISLIHLNIVLPYMPRASVSVHLMCAARSTNLILDLIILTFGKQYRLCSFLHHSLTSFPELPVLKTPSIYTFPLMYRVKIHSQTKLQVNLYFCVLT